MRLLAESKNRSCVRHWCISYRVKVTFNGLFFISQALRELIGALRAASLDFTAYFFSDNLLMFIHCVTIMYVLRKRSDFITNQPILVLR